MARGSKKLMTFQERLAKWAEGIRKQAGRLPPGPERDALLEKARQTGRPFGRMDQTRIGAAKVIATNRGGELINVA